MTQDNISSRHLDTRLAIMLLIACLLAALGAVIFPGPMLVGLVLIVAGFFGILATVRNPEIFVFLALATNFLKSAYIPGFVIGGEFGATPFMLFTTLGFVGLSVQILARKRRLAVPAGISFLLVYIVFTTLSLFIVTEVRLAAGSYVRAVLDWMFFFSLVQVLNSRRRFKQLVLVLLIQAVVVVAWGIISGLELERTGATFSMLFFWQQFQKNDFAAYLGFVLVFALATFILSRSRGEKIVSVGLMLAVPVGWMFTFSRGGFVAIVVCLIVFLALERNKALLRRAFIATFALSIVGIVLISLAPGEARDLAIDGLQSIFTGESVAERHTDTIEFRLQLIESSLDMIATRPLLGVGFNHWQLYSPLKTYVLDPQAGEYRLTGYSIHNRYLHIAANNGLIALSSYLAFIGVLLWTAIHRSRRAVDIWIRTYLHVFLAAVIGTQVALQFAPTVVWEWPLLGILAGLMRLVQTRDRLENRRKIDSLFDSSASN